MKVNTMGLQGGESAEGHVSKTLLERKYLTRRWVLVYLMCVVRICQAAVRQCIGMALVCMTHINSTDVTRDDRSPSAVNITVTIVPVSLNGSVGIVTGERNHTSHTHTGFNREFHWTSSFEGHVLGAYYYGFLLTVILAGYIDRALGSVVTIFVGVAGGGVVNILTPVMTRQHSYLLVALRVLAGCANGMIDPALHALLSRWAPVSERSQLASMEYVGVSVGGILTFLISGFLCEIPVDMGWPFVFYFYGGVSIVFSAVWLVFAKNSPEKHPTITNSELTFITENRSDINYTKKVQPPWLKICTSGAVWAILVAHVAFSWVYSWVLAYLPMYMEDVLRYEIAQNGVLSSLPFAVKLVAGMAGGYAADMLLRHHFSIVTVRKSFQMIGSLGCAAPLLVISFLSHEERGLAVALLILSVSLQNLTSVAYRINSLDIAPRFASFLMSITSAVACSLTLTAPYITSALLVTKSREEWQMVLYIVAAVSVLGGVVFLFFARGDVQPWARDSSQEINVEIEAVSPNEKLTLGNKHCDENGVIVTSHLLSKDFNGGIEENKTEGTCGRGSLCEEQRKNEAL